MAADDIDPFSIDAALQASESAVVNKALRPVPIPKITGMVLGGDIQLGDLVFNTIDENNVIWVITDIEGWWNHPEPEMEDIKRGFGDGSYDVRGRWTARQLTLQGVFLPPDRSYVAAAREKLIKAVDLVYANAYLRVSEDPVKVSKVRLSGAPNIKTVNNRGRTEFSIGLRAADPIKYSWNEADPDGASYEEVFARNTSLSRTGEIIVENVGAAYVNALFEITGPLVGPTVVFNETTDELMVISEPLESTDILEIDTFGHEVAKNGDITGGRAMLDVLADWIRLKPGPNVIKFYDEVAVNSTAKLGVYYRSGWLG